MMNDMSLINRLIRILLLGLLLTSSVCNAMKFPEKPSNEHFYVDLANTVDSETGEQIDQIAEALLREERVPLFVVILPSLVSQDAASSSVDRYAKALFDHWGIGFKDRNYGILLLVSLHERRARIELGADWGLESNYQSQQVMDKLIVPAFKRGDYATGLLDGVRGLDKMARGLDLPSPTAPWWFLPLVTGSFILLVLMIINLFKTGRNGWAWLLIGILAGILFMLAKALLSNSGSGSSGGFGGGFSGGGGASGSW